MSRTLDGAQDCLPGNSDRGVCPGGACWHGWLPHDLLALSCAQRERTEVLTDAGKSSNGRLVVMRSHRIDGRPSPRVHGVVGGGGRAIACPSRPFPAGLPAVR